MKQNRVWGGSQWTEKAVFGRGSEFEGRCETGLAFREQNWGGERGTELRGLFGVACLMFGSALRGQKVRICGSEKNRHNMGSHR